MTIDTSKRKLLVSGAAVAGMAIASGVILIAPANARKAGEPASEKVRWGLLIDSNKCDAGCDECVAACKTENGWKGNDRPTTDPQWIRKVNLKDKKTGARHSLPVMCQHCENPPCVDVCPTGASMQRADGVVLVNRHTCIGCRYCMLACPYKARSFVHEDVTGQKPHMPRGKGTVESCTLCVHRIDKGGTPACVEACSTKARKGAIIFGDLNDPTSDIAKELSKHVTTRLRADLGLEPGVHYRGI
ncbi:MAG: 4Fe-4S ferredoxin [Magnetovibrio sp.]|nr:4Fe-4S ferredoxin [Magnetovibrio sp.]|tara:strand:+ start:2008 stop:2742 length:735 start_codon:yes stop_codon:yes gene_type:complete